MPYADPEKRKVNAKAYYLANRDKRLAGHKKWREKNAEKAKAANKKWHEENREYHRAYRKSYYEKNRERCLAQSRESRKNNPEKVRVRNKVWREKNIDKVKTDHKKWYAENKERVRVQGKAYREKNRDKIKLDKKKWGEKNKGVRNAAQKIRRARDINYKLECVLRSRLHNALNGVCKLARTKELLGCSIEFLRGWLEKQFQPGMAWETYGLRGWHIDHKRPCAEFDLTDPAQQRECFHYTNLQPLWALDNLQKGATPHFSRDYLVSARDPVRDRSSGNPTEGSSP